MLQIAVPSIALVLSYLSVSALSRWAERHQVIDTPNARSCHDRPIPRGGGIAIVMLTLAGGWVFLLLSSSSLGRPGFLSYTIGAAAIAAVSWLDDLRSIPNLVRLIVHALGALLAALGLGYWHTIHVPFLGDLHLGVLGLPITFIWIVGLTNAYNFMDGIDGIAGGQAVVAGLGWAALGWTGHQPLVCMIGLVVATSSLGFLCHNWSPARVFMGDVGSAFLGYTFAVLPLLFNVLSPHDEGRGLAPLAGILVLWPFVFDTTYTFLRRVRSGENVFAAHRSHLYQRLVLTGFSHQIVSTLYINLSVLGVTLTLLFVARPEFAARLAGLVLPIAAICLALFVSRRENIRGLTPTEQKHSL